MTMSGIVEQVLKTTDIVGGGLFKRVIVMLLMTMLKDL
mgnify:CR=1 FL=1